jgi:hypothetical protein
VPEDGAVIDDIEIAGSQPADETIRPASSRWDASRYSPGR